MKYDFTEENLGKGYQLLELLVAKCLAQGLAIQQLVRLNPDAEPCLLALSENAGEMLQAHSISDQTITLIQENLANLANLRD